MQEPRNEVHQFIRSNWKKALLIVGIGLSNSLVTLLLPLCFGRFYELLSGTSNRGRLLGELGLGPGGGMAGFFWLFGGLVLAKGVLEWAEKRRTGLLGEQFAQALRERIFTHQLRQPIAVHRQKEVGKYLLRFGNDFRSLRNYLTSGILLFTRDALFMLLAVSMLTHLNPAITFWMLISALPFLLLFRAINRQFESISVERRDVRSSGLAFVSSRFQAIETIKVFNREPLEEKQFRQRSARLSHLNRMFINWRSLREALLPVATFSLIGVVLAAIALDHADGPDRSNGGLLIAFLLIALHMRPVVRRLLRVGAIWKTGRISLNKLTDLLKQPTEPSVGESVPDADPVVVEAENVGFRHLPAQPLIRHIDFRASPGSITLVTGAAGTGKSTLLHLLLKLHEPLEGRILLNGRDMRDLSVQSVRKLMTLVSDSVPLLGRTVFEAISYSRREEKRPRAEAMLNRIQDAAGLMPRMTLDQRIGEGGNRLSTSQRRVLMMVRALLTSKPILLLDEPFSGLSAASARRLGQIFNELAGKRTIILAAVSGVDGLQTRPPVAIDAALRPLDVNQV